MPRCIPFIHGLCLVFSVASCVESKSIGDDPDATATALNSTSSTSEDATTTITEASSGAGPAPGVPDYAGCGFELAPYDPDEPYYAAFFVCTTGCEIRMLSGLPIDLPDPEVGNCLCGSIGCGECCLHSAAAGPLEPPVGAGADTTAGTVCAFDPVPHEGPGSYQATCFCEECDVAFDGVVPSATLELYEERCACLCQEAGCGSSMRVGSSTSG